MVKTVHIALLLVLSAVRFFDLSILGLKLYIDWIGRCDDGLSNVVSPEIHLIYSRLLVRLDR